MAWYNKYRPQQFDDVIGQDLIKTVLKNTIESNTIKHAYLFNGPKGTGKTTMARIFANSLNHVEKFPEARFDIIEMDAASNTGVDDIRSLIDSSQNPPLSGKYKIYIIDEIHMLSKNAMNALLKILEEPPKYLIFLLATTNPEKLIPTILSRVTKLNLSSHTIKDIVLNLETIAKAENISIDLDSLELIAKQAEGGQRDAINLLETISSYNLNDYKIKDVSQFLGIAQNELIIKTLESVGDDKTDIIPILETCGIEGKNFLNQLLQFILDKSLYENSLEYDKIVIPLSELISLNLPINDAVSAFALLQSKLRNSNIITPKKNSENSTITPKTKTILPPKTEEKEIIKEELKDTKTIQPIEEPLVESVTQKDQTPETKSDQINKDPSSISTKQISNIIKEFAKISVFTIKLIGMDIKVESIEGNTIIVSVSNAVYLAQLNSKKNKGAFEDHIFEKTGAKFIIEPIKRTNNIKLEVSTSFDETKIENVNFIGGNHSEKEIIEEREEIKSDENTPHLDDNIPKSDIFYKVYKKLAPNMKGKGVEIFTGEINEPSKEPQKPIETTGWDNEINDFEFE